VAYIEEPTQDPKDAAAFTQATGVPHALDETLHGATAAGRTLWEDAAALVLKPTLSALVRLWQADPLDVFPAEAPLVISSSFESGLGLSVLTVLASNPRLRQPAGLDTFRWLAADVLDPPFAPEMGALRPAHSPSRLRWDLLHEVGRV
jgi:O-succinylbenzoate synthase